MFDYSMNEIKSNEKNALFFMEFKDFSNAEKILKKNINVRTDSILTYDLLIRIYHHKNDLSSLIRLLNTGIKNTDKKTFYRRLKKKIMLYKIFNDIDMVDA